MLKEQLQEVYFFSMKIFLFTAFLHGLRTEILKSKIARGYYIF